METEQGGGSGGGGGKKKERGRVGRTDMETDQGGGSGGKKKEQERVVRTGMETELYDAAVLMDQVLDRIEIREKSFLIGPRDQEYLRNLVVLKSDIFELLKKVFFLANTHTKVKLRALLSKRKIGCGLIQEFESWVPQTRADSEIGDKLKKMLLSIYKSVARSTKVPKGSFELGSISWLFDQMWDTTRQLQLGSIKARFLAISMLSDSTMVQHVSTLQLCFEDIVWLCTWVPEFAERLERVKKDDDMGERWNKGAEMEESMFASYIRSWERLRKRNNSISFEDSTALSPMMFTHYMPGHPPLFANVTTTMQIFSIKVTQLEEFKWPLEVYGVVAARDAADFRRNHLFLRSRDNCQFLTEKDCFLHLTGPSRAIMAKETVHIEIELKVKEKMKSEDRSLITMPFSRRYPGAADTSITHYIDGCFCKVEVCCEYLRESIQSTILSIQVTEGSLPKEDVQVICFALTENNVEREAEKTGNYVVLLDPKIGAANLEEDGYLDLSRLGAAVDEDGYLNLSRQVLCVQLKGRLEVFIKAGGMSGIVVFEPESSNISQRSCIIGDCKLEVTVAWSILADDEQDLLMMTYTKPFLDSPLPFMELVEDAEDRNR